MDRDRLFEFAQRYLKSVVVEAAESLDPGFDPATPFGDLGIDSFRVLRIVKTLEQAFGRLPKTLLFENFHVNDLARYFVERHGETLRALAAASGGVVAAPVRASVQAVAPVSVQATQTTAPAIVPASVPAPAPVKIERPAAPVLGLEAVLRDDPDLGDWVRETFVAHGNDGSVSRGTRNIAPNLFIGSRRLGYIHYARSHDRILGYAYTGPDEHYPELAEEFCRHAMRDGLHPNLLSPEPMPEGSELRFSATPFGVVQRILDLPNFTLAGQAMRRLRYLVQKFEKLGDCRTEEFRCGSDPDKTRDIVAILDAWCANRTMVNPLIHRVRAEILDGTLDPAHRLFVTWLDGTMQNVIMITPVADRFDGYLMDLEFYGPEMPLGGLEFTISRIVEALVAEGRGMLSLGGTYGCKIEDSPHADPLIDRALDELREQNLFNDAGNLQFKNKFRPENRTIYLCRPQGTGDPQDVLDLIMMVADPERMQTDDSARHTPLPLGSDTAAAADAHAPQAAAAFVAAEAACDAPSPIGLRGLPRSYHLAEAGFNPLNLDHAHVEFDLKTDSWAQLRTPAIEQRGRHLCALVRGEVDTDGALRAIFPFPHFILTRSGRTAERVLFRAWPRKGTVLQNLLFPTNLFHQIDNGFVPRELAPASLSALAVAAGDKGEIDLDALRLALNDADGIAMVCIEIGNNAAGGQPVSEAHLRAVSALLAPQGIPLVLDATRVLDNVCFGAPARHGAALWDAVRDLLGCADVVVASLPKNFGVAAGGLIATRDAALHARLQTVAGEEGCALGAFDRKLLGLSLLDRGYLEQRVRARHAAVATLAEVLVAQGVPVVRPAGAHCVLIDVAAIPEFAALPEPVAAFLAWLYLETGVRASGHNAGMARDRALARTVRLALALGTTTDEAAEIARRIGAAFADKRNLPELEAGPGAGTGDVNAHWRLRGYHRASAPVEARSAAETMDAAATPSTTSGAASATTQTAVQGTVMPGFAPSRGPVDVAIVGIAGRYPGANDMAELWQLLREGRDCVRDLPEARAAMRRTPGGPVRYRGGFIDDVEAFDAEFFAISEREALIMDPQERQFLEVAYEALEDAGYSVDTLDGDDGQRDIGVFVGAVWTTYQMVGADEKTAGRKVDPSSFLWSIANRVSYWMDLHGPSLTLDTACSSSLTAIKLACDAIRSGECRVAIAGGVNLDLHQSKYDINASGGSLSRSGTCRSYAEGADGYVSGEGVGALLLKPLEQAIADRDHVYGVIKSVAITHSGRTSAYTVPNPRTQTHLIAKALQQADVDARTIGYVEGHGTGTDLGDTIEVAGLARAFAAWDVPPESCPIGSIKTNIGHLEAASGVVGVQKILLQMAHGTLVPSLHADTPNPNIDFETTPFRIQRDVAPWDRRTIDGRTWPRRACISAIGIGGANAHLIVEEYIDPSADAAARADDPAADGLRVIPLSARTPAQLRRMAERLHAHLRGREAAIAIDDIAFTLCRGRPSFEQRLAVLAQDTAELQRRLAAFLDGTPDDGVAIGQADNARNVTSMLDAQEREDFVALLVKRGDPQRLARAWGDGLIADVRRLAPRRGRRVSLPTYPFARTAFWIGTRSDGVAFAAAPAVEAAPVEVARPQAAVPVRMRYRFWIDETGTGSATAGAPGGSSTIEKAELFVRQTLADRLGTSVETLSREHGMLEIGLDSLDMAALTTELKARFGPRFSPTAFFDCRTLGDFSRQLAEQYSAHFESMRFAKETVEAPEDAASARGPSRAEAAPAPGGTYLLDAAAPLDLPSTPWPASALVSPPRRILLTGATGFLGIHVLQALFAGDDAVRVRCLVRAADAEAALARLRAQAAAHALELDETRIEIVCGDIASPQLGMSDADWAACCEEVDQIVHAAAHVNHIEGYASFRDATLGMQQIVRLAASHRPKPVQFMSSTAACIQLIDDNFQVFEHESFIDTGETVYGGYGQSKWVQETLLRRAGEAGVPHVIYRFGELAGSSVGGHAQTDDMLHRLLQMRMAVDCREKISNDVLDALPVDVAARLIAGVSREPALWNAVLHGTHLQPCPIARVYKLAEQRLGRRFAPVTRQKYLAACLEFVQHVYAQSPVDGFVLECVLRDAEGSSRQRKIMDGYFAVLFPFEQGNFMRALKTLGMTLPSWDRLLATYFDRWCSEDCGYLSLLRSFDAAREDMTLAMQRSVAAAAGAAPQANIGMEAALEGVDEV
jgi:polyketide synthase PksN